MNIERINRKIFAALGQEKKLAEWHDIIYKLTGMVIDFINAEHESLKLSKMKHFNAFCAKLRNTPAGFSACDDCDRRNARSGQLAKTHQVYRCYAGLTEIVVPLFDSAGLYIGSMTGGQFLCGEREPEEEQKIREIARCYQLDEATLVEDYRKSPVLSATQLDGLILFLSRIGEIITTTHNRMVFLERTDSSDKISLVKRFVEENYMEKLSIPKVAKRFFLSPDYFSHFFSREVGMSFMNYVNMFRVSKAEELLKSTSLPISEIAFLTGFGSISQFNRTFRTIQGDNPGKIRRSRS